MSKEEDKSFRQKLAIVSCSLLALSVIMVFVYITQEDIVELETEKYLVYHYYNEDDSSQTIEIRLNTTDTTKFMPHQINYGDGVTWRFDFSEIKEIAVEELILGYDSDGYFCKVVNEDRFVDVQMCRDQMEQEAREKSGINYEFRKDNPIAKPHMEEYICRNSVPYKTIDVPDNLEGAFIDQFDDIPGMQIMVVNKTGLC